MPPFDSAGVHSNSHQDLYAECRARTCSITCCSAHKQVSQCSGKRSRHEYVPAANYDESTMISDYMLLEEGVNVQSTLQNGTSPFVTGQNSQVRSRKGAQELLKAALRSSIDLKFMPAGMQRHITNTTFFRRRDHCICWRVELRFPVVPTIIHVNGINESETIAQVLETVFSSRHGSAAQSVQLAQYAAATPALCDIFHQREQVPSSCNRIKRVQIEQTVRDALRGECIIEFPIFIVQLRHKWFAALRTP